MKIKVGDKDKDEDGDEDENGAGTGTLYRIITTTTPTHVSLTQARNLRVLWAWHVRLVACLGLGVYDVVQYDAGKLLL
jgi:hypothetical protein